MQSPRRLTLGDQIRKAIEDSGQTRYQISQATGVDQSSLSKFARGRRGLSLEKLNILAEHLELEVTAKADNSITTEI